MEDKNINTKKEFQLNKNTQEEEQIQVYGALGNKYILLEKLGKGLSSHVYLAKKISTSPKSSKNLVAIKICRKKYNQKMFNEEGMILKKLPLNPHIIKIYDSGKGLLTKKKSYKTRIALYHVLEYLENGILFDYINFKNNISKGFGEKLGRIIFYQILLGVEFCHKNSVSHKDIKLENLLLDSNYQIKLADFGFASDECILHNNKPKFSIYGTTGYFPPEVYINNSMKNIDSFILDIFALGICLFYIVCGFKPFNDTKRSDPFYKKILRRNYEGFWNDIYSKTGELSKNFKELMNKMFASNVEERYISIEQIKKDEWILEGRFDDLKELNENKVLLISEFERRKKCMYS